MLESRLHEFREAAIAVLDHDVISATTDRDTHTLVRRQAQDLNAWFGSRVGWRVSDHPEFVRLIKRPARPEVSLAAGWAAEARDYELLAWVLWFAEEHGARKFVLSALADGIREKSSEKGEASFDWLRHSDRLRLCRVMEALERTGAVRVHDGSAREWALEEGERDALYEWGALTWQIHVPYGPEILTQLSAGTMEKVPLPETAPVPPRMRLYRALLLSPACFRRDDSEAFAILEDADTLRGVARDIADHTGLELEKTTSYARLLRSTAHSDAVIPPIPVMGSEGQLITLLCGAIRRLRDSEALVSLGDDWYAVPGAMLEIAIGRVKDQHGDNWKKDYRRWSTKRLLTDLIPAMRRLGLLRGPDDGDTYEVSPLVARLDGYYPEAEGGAREETNDEEGEE